MNTSPTGKPLVAPQHVKILLAVYAALVATAEALPQHTIAAQILKVALPILGPVLGMLSPGLRAKPVVDAEEATQKAISILKK